MLQVQVDTKELYKKGNVTEMRREKRPQREKTMTKRLKMTTKKQRKTTEECKTTMKGL